jgi:hypothetical protein
LGGNTNFITLANNFTEPLSNNDTILIDLESHLNNQGVLSGYLDPDWDGKTIIVGATPTLNGMLSRLVPNTFTGTGAPMIQLWKNYEIQVSGTNGIFAKQ